MLNLSKRHNEKLKNRLNTCLQDIQILIDVANILLIFFHILAKFYSRPNEWL